VRCCPAAPLIRSSRCTSFFRRPRRTPFHVRTRSAPANHHPSTIPRTRQPAVFERKRRLHGTLATIGCPGHHRRHPEVPRVRHDQGHRTRLCQATGGGLRRRDAQSHQGNARTPCRGRSMGRGVTMRMACLGNRARHSGGDARATHGSASQLAALGNQNRSEVRFGLRRSLVRDQGDRRSRGRVTRPLQAARARRLPGSPAGGPPDRRGA
jgi:hypothetical protein